MLAAAVTAGIRSGDLTKSVEMLGDMADDLVSIRGKILSSLSYPLTIVAMAFVLFVVFIRGFLVNVAAIIDDHEIHASPAFRFAIEFDQTYWWWPFAGLAAAMVVGIIWLCQDVLRRWHFAVLSG